MILLSGKIPLKTHQSGHVVGGNGGFNFFAQNAFKHGYKFSIPLSNGLGGFS
jgi:hypothetical protein